MKDNNLFILCLLKHLIFRLYKIKQIKGPSNNYLVFIRIKLQPLSSLEQSALSTKTAKFIENFNLPSLM